MAGEINEQELKKLLKNLENLPAKMQKGILNLAVKAGSKDIQQAAISYAPSATGQLRKSIVVKKKRQKDKVKDGQDKTSTVYTVGIKLDGKAWRYAHFVEFGTKRMAADPFMVPAYELNGNGALNAMKAYIKRQLEKAIKKGLIR